MELKKKSWRDVTINEYIELKEKLSDDSLKEYEIEVIKISFSSGIPENEIWNLSMDDFRSLQIERLWMDEFPLSREAKFKNISISEERFNIETDIRKLTVAQYIDFQTFYPKLKNDDRYIGNVLACFIIPYGKKYADEYDVEKLVNNINDNLDILTANEILFFFLKQYLISTRAIANYLNWLIKMKRKKLKDKKQISEIEQKWLMMKKHILAGLQLLTK